MYISHFGKFLVEKGLVEAEHVLEALNRQKALQRPIGQIAIEQHFLKPQEVFEILNLQVECRKRFGEIAVEMATGCLSEPQVQSLVDIQQSERPHIGDILVEMGVIDRKALVSALSDFLSNNPAQLIKRNAGSDQL